MNANQQAVETLERRGWNYHTILEDTTEQWLDSFDVYHIKDELSARILARAHDALAVAVQSVKERGLDVSEPLVASAVVYIEHMLKQMIGRRKSASAAYLALFNRRKTIPRHTLFEKLEQSLRYLDQAIEHIPAGDDETQQSAVNRHPLEDALRLTPTANDTAHKGIRALLAATDTNWEVTGAALQSEGISACQDPAEAAQSVYQAILKRFSTTRPYLHFRRADPPAVYLTLEPKPVTKQ